MRGGARLGREEGQSLAFSAEKSIVAKLGLVSSLTLTIFLSSPLVDPFPVCR